MRRSRGGIRHRQETPRLSELRTVVEAAATGALRWDRRIARRPRTRKGGAIHLGHRVFVFSMDNKALNKRGTGKGRYAALWRAGRASPALPDRDR